MMDWIAFLWDETISEKFQPFVDGIYNIATWLEELIQSRGKNG